MAFASILLPAAVMVVGLFAAYSLFHYILYLLVTNPKNADEIGHELNEFERRQLVEWLPKPGDFLKHDDQSHTYDDVFRYYLGENENYCTCVFPPTFLSHPYSAAYALLEPAPGMRLLDLGSGSGAAACYLAGRCAVEVLCVTNSPVQADLCRRKAKSLDGRVHATVADFDHLDLPEKTFDAIYSLESIGYTKDLDAWLARCWRLLKPGGRLLLLSPGSLDRCRSERDYRNVTAFFENWRYNFFGANLPVFKMRRLGFDPIRYRQLPFLAWALTWSFLRRLLFWKFRLRMRTMVHLERIIWNTSKAFVFGNAYNIVLAYRPLADPSSRSGRRSP
ncbi:MAG: methyltransferase domain-containing protein [Methylacidiphilaceae bacterium]|nr:methyltransferase domain-containing protein [Candidatus Methylacidiphilaceae bacterium]